MSVITKSYTLKVASAEDAGTFIGTAVPYNVADSIDDVMRAGCFRKSIVDAEGLFPCLWTHDPLSVLGTVKVESDNSHNLAVSGALLLDAVPKAREIHELMKARAIRGLSIGFVPLRAVPRPNGGREVVEARLLEVSLCAAPAYVGAQVTEVRSLTAPDEDEARLVLKALTFDASKWKFQMRVGAPRR